MKVLLDECFPRGLCKSLPCYECHAARAAGFGGKKNSALLDAAELAGFDVLITVDRSIPHQQKLTGRKLALVVIFSRSNKLEVLTKHAAACVNALRSIERGEVVRIGDV